LTAAFDDARLEESSPAPRDKRGGVLKDYRLRVAAVTRDYSMFERSQAPEEPK